MSLNHILRLRGSAVSLSREAHKAERRLGQLQKARLANAPVEAKIAPEPEQPQPNSENTTGLIEQTGKVLADAKSTSLIWTQAYQQSQRAKRIAVSMIRNPARHAAQRGPAAPA